MERRPEALHDDRRTSPPVGHALRLARPAAQVPQHPNAPKVPAALASAGVTFAFSSAGLRDPREFVRNAGWAEREGLPADAAIRALTIDAARIAGATDRLGSLETGKIANIVVTAGDLFDERMQVKHVFVDGRPVDLEALPAPGGGRGGRGAVNEGLRMTEGLKMTCEVAEALRHNIHRSESARTRDKTQLNRRRVRRLPRRDVRRVDLRGLLASQRFGGRSRRFHSRDLLDWIRRGAPTRVS